MSRPLFAAGIFYAPQRKDRSEPVCIFAAIFNRVFRSRKIRLTFFKICQTYFKWELYALVPNHVFANKVVSLSDL